MQKLKKITTNLVNDYFLISILIIGLAVRLFLIPLSGFKFDIDAWFAWAIRLNQFSLAQFYSDKVWTNYTPGFLYVLFLLGKIKFLFNLSDQSLYFLIKIPSIIAEVLLGIFIYLKLKNKSIFWARIALCSILFSPSFIFNSSVWGQIDGFLSMFILLAIFFLDQKKLILSSVLFGLAFLVKPQAIAIAPIFVLYLFKNFSFKNLFKIILPASLTIFVLSLVFFPTNPLGIITLFSKMVSDYSYTSAFAYNFWGVIGFWINDQNLWHNLSYQRLGQIIFAIYWIIIFWAFLKCKLSLFSAATLALLGFYFLPTRVHDRYLYPALIFLFLISGYFKSRMLFILSIILSLLHFLNLYYVYVYYNEIYLKLPKLLYNPFLYNFLDNHGKSLSLISCFIFVLISINIIKLNENIKNS